MNALADNLALKLRGDLDSLPGATSISFHAQEKWALCLITASSDEGVISLGKKLGLTCDIRSEEGWWWRIAIGEREGGAIRCEVSGPRTRGQPPGLGTERAERMATAPVILTAEQVLEAARARGVPAFDTTTGERLVLLASLGLDLARADIRDALLALHQGDELRLVHISNPSVVRADLDSRGFRFELVDESALRNGNMAFHAVVLSCSR